MLMIIGLTQGKKAIVSKADFNELNKYKWYAAKEASGNKWYAVRHEPGNHSKLIRMHRVVCKTTKQIVDHINGNTLDNRRSNLRGCTYGQNKQNSVVCKHNRSGYKGVYFNKNYQRWVGQIYADGKRYCKAFDRLEDAVSFYNDTALKVHGKFARLN